MSRDESQLRARLSAIAAEEASLIKARVRVMRELEDDGELQRALNEWAVAALLAELWRAPRTQMWAEATGEREVQVSRPSPVLLKALDRKLSGLQLWPMPNHTYLGNWTKKDLVNYGRTEVAKSQSALRHAHWILAVADSLKKDKDTVADHLSNADLERLARKQNFKPQIAS